MDYTNIIVSLFGIVTGIFGVIFGLKKDRHVKLEAIKQYYDESNSEELRRIRKKVAADMKKGDLDFQTISEEGKMIGFYDKWGELCAKGYLPLWLFEGAPGYHVVSQYEYFKEYIEFRREETYKGHKNTGYALYFEKLAHKIMKRYKY